MKQFNHFIIIVLLMTNHLQAQMPKKALLVIDLQQNLLDSGSRMHVDPSQIQALCDHVNQVIQSYQKNGWPVLYVTNEWTNPLLNFLTGNVVKKGAPGTGIDHRIDIVNQTIYKKSTGNALANKELAQAIKDQGIQELTLVGVFAENCIKETMLSGLKNGYPVTIVEDAVGSRSARSQHRSIAYYKKKGAKIIQSAHSG